ncbi:resistance to Congo red protein [Clostridium aminobutyricum]|uniref:DUF5666 domain-containing protein n=1 Tax=Clostridium aminobutyricum TaxID=33953 RepID=A0A939IHY2_CLOAM|nr:proline-rich domain-containing protein [Clostridium aminobutyricum]MBN7774342.1 hypothetical protein [Clostridium aminobutyricum]
MKKLVSCILVGSLVTAMVLSGCGSSQAETDSNGSNTKKAVDGIQYGQILSISDSEIVLALGTMDQKTPSGDRSGQTPPEDSSGSAVLAPNDGQAPQGRDSQGNTPPQGNPPSGDNGGNSPSGGSEGNPPSGNNAPANGTSGSGIHAGGPGKSMIALTGDKLTITVSDSTSITYMKAQGDTSDTSATRSDLKEGDVIAVTLDEDGKTAMEITIMSMKASGETPKTTNAAASTEE